MKALYPFENGERGGFHFGCGVAPHAAPGVSKHWVTRDDELRQAFRFVRHDAPGYVVFREAGKKRLNAGKENGRRRETCFVVSEESFFE